MNAQLITFFILAIIAIAAALGMLFSRSAVYSALFLVLNFGTVAVFYIILNAPFIAMAQVSVYAGAIMVLVPVRHHVAGNGIASAHECLAVAETAGDLPRP